MQLTTNKSVLVSFDLSVSFDVCYVTASVRRFTNTRGQGLAQVIARGPADQVCQADGSASVTRRGTFPSPRPGQFPASMRTGLVTPLLKKPRLDAGAYLGWALRLPSLSADDNFL